jgi:caspase domain-containing protein
MKTGKQSAFLLAILLALSFGRAETKPSSPKGGSKTRPSGAAWSLSPANAPQPHGKWALLVGINNYKYSDKISPLAGSLNDVEAMRQVLVGKFEFPSENILVLKDSQATHAAIINAIQTHLIAKAQPGDIVVFHYSGHGSQMKDVTGKMISGLDETLVPFDSRGGQVFDISGAEIHPLLLQLAKKTPNVTFILDSCHSGTLVRGARVRWVGPDTRTPPPLPAYSVAATRELGTTNEEALPKFVSIAAATSRESAFEHFADGEDHGALTYFLTQQLRIAKAGATYRDVVDVVQANIRANFYNQTVSVEGADADQYVFGDRTSLARTYVMASPSSITSHAVTLSTGQVHGATVGSTYDIYAPGSKKFAPPERPVAKVRLAAVGPFTSEATYVSSGSVTAASRAVEREHKFGRLRLRVFLDGVENSAPLQSIKSALEPLANIEVVGKISICNIQLREAGERILTLGADSTTLSPPVAVSDPNVVEKIVGQIKGWAKWFNILSIRNPSSEIELQFTLAGSQTRDPMARVGKPDMGLKVGEKVDATITNNSARDIYIYMLDLSSDGSISMVYPKEAGVQEVLKPGLRLTRTLTATLPAGRDRVEDILKVFGSYKPINLSVLEQPQIRDAVEEELQQLLAVAAGGTRGLTADQAPPMVLGQWGVAQRLVVVRR